MIVVPLITPVEGYAMHDKAVLFSTSELHLLLDIVNLTTVHTLKCIERDTHIELEELDLLFGELYTRIKRDGGLA